MGMTYKQTEPPAELLNWVGRLLDHEEPPSDLRELGFLSTSWVLQPRPGPSLARQRRVLEGLRVPEEVPSGGTVNKFSPRLMNYPSLIDQYLIGVAHEVMQ